MKLFGASREKFHLTPLFQHGTGNSGCRAEPTRPVLVKNSRKSVLFARPIVLETLQIRFARLLSGGRIAPKPCDRHLTVKQFLDNCSNWLN